MVVWLFILNMCGLGVIVLVSSVVSSGVLFDG